MAVPSAVFVAFDLVAPECPYVEGCAEFVVDGFCGGCFDGLLYRTAGLRETGAT